jgi:hypothetical protein
MNDKPRPNCVDLDMYAFAVSRSRRVEQWRALAFAQVNRSDKYKMTACLDRKKLPVLLVHQMNGLVSNQAFAILDTKKRVEFAFLYINSKRNIIKWSDADLLLFLDSYSQDFDWRLSILAV